MQIFKRSLEGLVLLASLTTPPSKTDEKQYQLLQTEQVYGQAEVYPSGIQMIDGKPVINQNKYQMGDNILGLCWTYSGLIAILEGLKGRDREKVLEHEVGHRENPMRSEEENRRKTYTEEPNMHPMVSYLG